MRSLAVHDRLHRLGLHISTSERVRLVGSPVAAHTRDFSFGTGLSDAGLPEEVWAILKRWADELSEDGFAEDVSSKGVEAWAVRHNAGVQHQDDLVERLGRVVSELASL